MCVCKMKGVERERKGEIDPLVMTPKISLCYCPEPVNMLPAMEEKKTADVIGKSLKMGRLSWVICVEANSP